MDISRTLEIDSLSFGGAGVGRLDSGKVAFVHGAAPGDLVRVRILQDKPSQLIGEIEELLEPSPHRVTSPCVSSDRCGGCDWMHIDVETQRAWKTRLLKAELDRAGFLKGDSSGHSKVLQDLVCGAALGHRTRTRMHRRGNRFGTLAARSHEVIPLIECPILAPELAAFAIDTARALERAPRFSADVELYVDTKGRRGMSVVFRSGGSFSVWRSISKKLDLAAFRITSGEGRVLASSGGELTEESKGVSVDFLPGLFVQSNREMNAQLVKTAIESSGQGEVFAEIYSGVGNFTVHLASRFEKGAACEGSRAAAELLERNLGESARQIRVRAEPDFRSAQWLAQMPAVDLLLADPPRAGMKPLRPLFAQAPPRRVVLASCHPMAAIRDIRHLTETAGYRLVRVVPLDLFPQTSHLELVAELVKRREFGRGPRRLVRESS